MKVMKVMGVMGVMEVMVFLFPLPSSLMPQLAVGSGQPTFTDILHNQIHKHPVPASPIQLIHSGRIQSPINTLIPVRIRRK